MTIREATEEDLPEMLHLLHQSLGSLGGIRTEAYWRWKHLVNPFGVSSVLLAIEGEELIGLRAFMPWRFRFQGSTLQAYRAVDTATHPTHQGKGIFSKLTLTLIGQLKEGMPAVIFNTPNSKSMPGYLKMGWKEVGKTRLRARIYPLNIIRNRILKSSIAGKVSEAIQFPEDMETILMTWTNNHNDVVLTDYSIDYLRWRYQAIPALQYQLKVVRDGSQVCVIIYRMKVSPRAYELRVVEVFYSGDDIGNVVRKAIRELANEHTPDVITLLADPAGKLTAVLPFGFVNAEKYGLTITARKVNDDGLERLAMEQDKWFFTAGGLELF